MVFKSLYKPTGKILTVYAVRNSPFGLPCFFVNIDGEWRYISARYFSFVNL